MNTSAENALLKVLEEPPAKTIILLISHQPAKLLPTIRSRCRELRCNPLSPGALGQVMAQAGFPDDNNDTLSILEVDWVNSTGNLTLFSLGGVGAANLNVTVYDAEFLQSSETPSAAPPTQ